MSILASRIVLSEIISNNGNKSNNDSINIK